LLLKASNKVFGYNYAKCEEQGHHGPAYFVRGYPYVVASTEEVRVAILLFMLCQQPEIFEVLRFNLE